MPPYVLISWLLTQLDLLYNDTQLFITMVTFDVGTSFSGEEISPIPVAILVSLPYIPFLLYLYKYESSGGAYGRVTKSLSLYQSVLDFMVEFPEHGKSWVYFELYKVQAY